MNKFFILIVLLISAKIQAQNSNETKNGTLTLNGQTVFVDSRSLVSAIPINSNDVIWPIQLQGQTSVWHTSIRSYNETQSAEIDLTKFVSTTNADQTAFAYFNSATALNNNVAQSHFHWGEVSANQLLNDSIFSGSYQISTSSLRIIKNDLNSFVPVNDSSATFILNTSSLALPHNNEGAFVIQNSEQNQFLVGVNNSTAVVGWNHGVNLPLVINASEIDLNGVVNAKNGFVSTDGLYIDATKIPENIQGYFASHINSSAGVLIANENTGINAGATIFFDHASATSFISTMPIKSFSGDDLKDALVLQSNAINGIYVNTMANERQNAGSIRFAINSNNVFVVDNIYQGILIGTMTPEASEVLTVRSTYRGVSFSPMTSEQRRKIRNPKESDLVYDTDIHKYCFHNGSHWEEILSKEIE